MEMYPLDPAQLLVETHSSLSHTAQHKHSRECPSCQPEMAAERKSSSLFCSKTMTYESPRGSVALPLHNSISDYAFSLLQPCPTSPAVIDASTGRSITFPELLRRVQSLSSSLRHLSPGDSALILSPNSLHLPILLYSLFSLRVAASPSNPLSSPHHIHRLLTISRPVIAFASDPAVARNIPPLRHGTIILDSPEFHSMMATPAFTEPTRNSRSGDTAAILYSSGTTGQVKGVALAHASLMASVAGVLAAREGRRRAVMLCAVPMFHVYGFGVCVRAVAMGDTLVVMSGSRFDLRAMVRAIEGLRVSHLAVAPPTVTAMLGVMDGCDMSSLEVVACGGALLSRGAVERFRKRLPNVQLAQAYGLTETTGRIFGTVGWKEAEVVGATGRLISNCQAKIVDPDTGMFLPPHNPGELWVRGPLIMKGYVGEGEETARVLDSEGWLSTGDLCYIDDQGFLFFVDRIKEMIKYKGYQVAPAELEHLLQSHPDIVEAAVAGYPDEEAGQLPMAFVVRHHASDIDELQIKHLIAQQVPPYKKIRKVKFLNSIPKNATGKVLRKELIKLALLDTGSKL